MRSRLCTDPGVGRLINKQMVGLKVIEGQFMVVIRRDITQQFIQGQLEDSYLVVDYACHYVSLLHNIIIYGCYLFAQLC